jgi:glutamate dehydrogenase
MPDVLTEHLAARFEQEVQQVRAEGVPAAIASAYAQHGFLSPALSLIETANACGESLETMTAAYHFMGAALQLDWLEELIAGIAPNSVWESQVRTTALEDLTWRQRVLARRLLRETEGVRGVQKRVDAWFAKNESELSRSRAVLSALQAEPVPDLAMVTVAMRELKKLS